jgi:tRNA-dihydrouridine synthase C
VNRHDGGASLLRHPTRIREIVGSVRAALPADVPVSAKLRLGWDQIDAVFENAAMAAEGGASWLTIHARTRVQGYAPPVYWGSIGKVRETLRIPVIANGDIWTVEDFRRCRDETGCLHFMIGRGTLANPSLPYQIAGELGIADGQVPRWEWEGVLRDLLAYTEMYRDRVAARSVLRLKQWLKLAANHGEFRHFDQIKRCETVEDFFGCLAAAEKPPLASALPHG